MTRVRVQDPADDRARIERRLGHVCASLRVLCRDRPTSTAVASAIRYALLSGGKRIRPAVCLAAFRSPPTPAAPSTRRRPSWSVAVDAAAAVEMLHAASLILDDLPCMDDALLRRARPCTHLAFGEPTAIVAADLMVLSAFQVAIGELPRARKARREGRRKGRRRRRRRRKAKAKRRRERRARRAAERAPRHAVLAELLAACEGMSHGQMLDLMFPSSDHLGPLRTGGGEGVPAAREAVLSVHLGKTGALFEAAAVAGALAAGAASRGAAAWAREYGRALGLAFQIADDVLDTTETCATTGKTGGHDVASGKPSFVAVAGVAGSREEVRRLTARAAAAGGGEGTPLGRFAAMVRDQVG